MRSALGTLRTVAIMILAAIATGCASVGPITVARDRFDYDPQSPIPGSSRRSSTS